MALSEQDRQRIYEEEKARHEMRRAIDDEATSKAQAVRDEAFRGGCGTVVVLLIVLSIVGWVIDAIIDASHSPVELPSPPVEVRQGNDAKSTSQAGKGGYSIEEAAKVAVEFQAAVFSLVPKASRFIESIDIEIEGRHLMIWPTDALLRTDKKTQDEVYSALRDMWRQTKYVRDMGYNRTVEVIIFDPAIGDARTIRMYK